MTGILKVAPLVNSLINLISGYFILRGVRAIRRREVGAHRQAMLIAAALQGLFLAIYLLRVSLGGFTRFEGPAPVRAVYLALLLVHSVLAAVQTPIILYVLYQGLKGNFRRHRPAARFVTPIWLFVSFTGPLIYVLLHFPYHRL
ncbi:MAG: DUF420 domain-containing protein [Firmicutes bacterium]|nr:DUF420 domain-containing protein [Bacillota bacterium]